jgi:hypothetical protein
MAVVYNFGRALAVLKLNGYYLISETFCDNDELSLILNNNFCDLIFVHISLLGNNLHIFKNVEQVLEFAKQFIVD